MANQSYFKTIRILGFAKEILTPRNDRASAINDTIFTSIQGDSIEYCSINRVIDEEDATNFPIEFLNSLSALGLPLPQHKIHLKVGVPIILLRNLSPPK